MNPSGAAVLIIALTLLVAYLAQGAGPNSDTALTTTPQPGQQKLSVPLNVDSFAKAIANAEGFGIPGAIPTVAHNPGDLVIPNWQGQKMGSEGISVFADDNEGWNRLYNQLMLIIAGASHVYSLNMTIAEMAAKWTATDQAAWANNVASFIGATVDTPISAQLTPDFNISQPYIPVDLS